MRYPADNVARIAAQQHGRVTFAQLRAAGVDEHRIRRWVADGRLHREHVGVFAAGHPGRSVLGAYMSAVLAAGDGAVLSHRAAAHLLRLLPGAAPPPAVTIPTLNGRARPGVVIHRVRALHQLDTSELHAIPITTVPRVLLDLAIALTQQELTRACHEAWIRHRTTPQQIDACIARNPAKPGAPAIRRALATDVTLSILEDAFLELLRHHHLPRPRTNIDHAGDKVDCHWPDLGLTVELVSWRFHGTRRAFEQDVARRRRSHHTAFSYGDVTERPQQTIAELEALGVSATASGSS
jgi:hypothetical protein